MSHSCRYGQCAGRGRRVSGAPSAAVAPPVPRTAGAVQGKPQPTASRAARQAPPPLKSLARAVNQRPLRPVAASLTRVVSHHYLRVMTETAHRETGQRHVRQRMPAAERRELVLEAAVAEFAVHGLAGTSTEDVARRAGISQPYLFRLFPTKKALFLALVERCFRRVEDTFTAAAGDLTGDEAMTAMADSYTRL